MPNRPFFRVLALMAVLCVVGMGAGCSDLKNDFSAPSAESNDPFILQRAVDKGDAKAQNKLGMMYYRGQGVPQNLANAAALFYASAEQGNAWAQTNLGMMYLQGQGLRQDSARGAAYLQKAADQGFVLAQNNLGMMYLQGHNDVKAAVLLQKAADQGYPMAQFVLGEMYIVGRGVPNDIGKACALLRLAAANGISGAQDAIDRNCPK